MDDFDTLKREATKLERHLEDKVARYQQLVQRFPAGTTAATSSSRDNDFLSMETGAASSSSSAAAQQQFDEEEATLRHDIQRTLTTMQDFISTKLSPAADQSSSGGSSNNSSRLQLLVKRYREILFDLSGDFEKSNQSLTRKRERAELLRGANGDGNGASGTDPAMEHLLRERNHIHNSLNAASNVISQAAEVHADLRNQGFSLRGVQGTMSKIAGNIPGLNSLVERIRRKRSRDDMIVAGVIALCICFTLWYLFG